MKVRQLVAVMAAALLLSLTIGFVFARDAAPEMTPVPGSGMITGPMDGEATSLNGGGSTFDQPLFTTWFSDYATLTNVQINYQGIGSGGGVKGITDGTLDFGASDAPMTDDQLAAAKSGSCGTDVLHIAVTLGGVAITYNVPELAASGEALKFTPDTLAGIFLGEIVTWNDEKLVADNPSLKDVAQPIAVVHRSDGSGTSNIFTTYLKAVNQTWADNVGSGSAVKWPTGIGQKGSAGVAGAISGVPYSIGYVELTYATQNSLPVAQIANKAGTFLVPSTDTVSNAAAGVQLPDDLRIMIVNGDGDNTYSISGFSWVLVCANQTDAAKATALARVLWWAIHDGQTYGAPLGYAPLPAAAITADEKQILKIMVNGAQALPTSIATPAP